jgi:hypothetical protein
MSARVAVLAGASAPRIEVPVAALSSRGEQAQVFVVEVDRQQAGMGVVQPRAVKTAGISDERVAIADGLRTGDVVVAAGAALLRAGQRVRLLEGG